MNTTAVEYLVEQLLPKALSAEQYYHIQQAKEMEKQQIIDAWYDGQNDFEREVEMYAFGEEYYNNMIKSEENGK